MRFFVASMSFSVLSYSLAEIFSILSQKYDDIRDTDMMHGISPTKECRM